MLIRELSSGEIFTAQELAEIFIHYTLGQDRCNDDLEEYLQENFTVSTLIFKLARPRDEQEQLYNACIKALGNEIEYHVESEDWKDYYVEAEEN